MAFLEGVIFIGYADVVFGGISWRGFGGQLVGFSGFLGVDFGGY